MDTLLASQIFRRLFLKPARNCLRKQQGRHAWTTLPLTACRAYATSRRRPDDPDGGSRWQQRIDAFPRDMSKQLKEYPKMTAPELRHRTNRPTRVKMLTREFIEDSLYNPNYGYFSKHATIFNPGEPFDFSSISDGPSFNRLVDLRYIEFEDDLDSQLDIPDETRQLWHTPTELFRPYYGEAIARYLVTNYKMTLYPYHDLIIYEMGAGNGTLMRNILDYIRDTEPEVYARTKFKIIEISHSLANLQLHNLSTDASSASHLDHIEIINRSIFDWTTYTPNPCFFLALEVIDNFAHDVLRYDPASLQPLQGHVLIDSDGEFFEYYERALDPLASEYLHLRRISSRRGPSSIKTPLTSQPAWLRRLRHSLPLAPNLTKPEYIPTRLLQFLHVLATHFPAHRLLLSDFTSLPTIVPGSNAPVVQTRYQRRNVPVTTPLVHQGYFDVFFPTDFELLEDMYRAVTGKLTRVTSQREFLRGWADTERTRVGDGENVMLSWYRNVGVMTTV